LLLGDTCSCTISPLQPVESLESPIDRLYHAGLDSLSAEELVALILQAGKPGQGGLGTARRLAQDFGSIASLARARPEELMALSDLTPEQAAALASSFRLGRLAECGSVPPRLASTADVAGIATRELSSATRERVIVLVCDAANHLQRVVQVSEGSLDRAFLPVREILNAVLRHDGRAFAIAHNHPSGNPTPGREDIQATEKLRTAAQVLGLRFLDHVVVAGGAWQSAMQQPGTRR
jgi:DNA repair protein RadC